MPIERAYRAETRSETLGLRHTHTGFRHSHAIVIGVNRYPRIKKPLISAVPDAWETARLLWAQQGFTHVWLMVNPLAKSVQKVLNWMKNPDRPAQFPLKPWREVAQTADAKALETHLGKKLGKLGNRDRLIYLHHGHPFEGIRSGDRDEGEQSGDSFLFYYAGHGQAGKYEAGPAGYLLPTDVKRGHPMRNRIPMEEVLAGLQTVNCQHTLLILDCCFAGKFRHIQTGTRFVEDDALRPMTRERFERFLRKPAWQVLVSAGPDQTAADWMTLRDDGAEKPSRRNAFKLPHSPFAQGLFEALDGSADFRELGSEIGDGVLTANELKTYLFHRVQRSTFENPAFAEQHPDLFPMGSHAGGQFIFINPRHPYRKFAEFQHLNPYRGLSPFQKDDWPFFYGRKEEVERLFSLVKENRFTLLTAPSAQGKTSLVRAGLFPRWEQAYTGSMTHQLRPGIDPPEQFRQLVQTARQQSHQPILLLLDQYEEHLTHPQRANFEVALLASLSHFPENLHCVCTLRSDYEWQFFQTESGKELQQAGGFTHFRLPEISLDDLRETLVQPALVRGFEFESKSLENEILLRLYGAPAALSLLSVTLKEWFALAEKEILEVGKDRRILTRAQYEQLGGIEGTLSRRADQVFESFSTTEQDAIKKLFLRMVEVGQGGNTRRKVLRRLGLDEWDYPGVDFDQLRQKIEAHYCSEAIQLWVRGKQQGIDFVEPVHDALINHWQRCLTWIEEAGRENLHLQRQLWEAIRENHLPRKAGVRSTDYGMRTSTSKPFNQAQAVYWDRNPKILQVISLIMEAGKPLFTAETDNPLLSAYWNLPEHPDFDKEAVRNACKQVDYVFDLEALVSTGMSGELLEVFLDHAPHWLNQAEVDFVRESWGRRAESAMQIKVERNQAYRSLISRTAQTSPDRVRQIQFAMLKGQIDPYERSVVQSLVAQVYFSQEPYWAYLSFDSRKDFFPEDGLRTISSEGNYMAYAKGGGLYVWDIAERKERWQSLHFGTEFTALDISASGEWLYTGTKTGEMKRWPLNPAEMVTYQYLGKTIAQPKPEDVIALGQFEGRIEGIKAYPSMKRFLVKTLTSVAGENNSAELAPQTTEAAQTDRYKIWLCQPHPETGSLIPKLLPKPLSKPVGSKPLPELELERAPGPHFGFIAPQTEVVVVSSPSLEKRSGGEIIFYDLEGTYRSSLPVKSVDADDGAVNLRLLHENESLLRFVVQGKNASYLMNWPEGDSIRVDFGREILGKERITSWDPGSKRVAIRLGKSATKSDEEDLPSQDAPSPQEETGIYVYQLENDWEPEAKRVYRLPDSGSYAAEAFQLVAQGQKLVAGDRVWTLGGQAIGEETSAEPQSTQAEYPWREEGKELLIFRENEQTSWARIPLWEHEANTIEKGRRPNWSPPPERAPMGGGYLDPDILFLQGGKQVLNVGTTHNGRYVVFGGRNRGFVVWDVKHKRPIFEELTPGIVVTKLAFHPKRSQFAIINKGFQVHLYDISAGTVTERVHFRIPLESGSVNRQFRYSAGGRHLYFVDQHGAFVWQSFKGRLLVHVPEKGMEKVWMADQPARIGYSKAKKHRVMMLDTVELIRLIRQKMGIRIFDKKAIEEMDLLSLFQEIQWLDAQGEASPLIKLGNEDLMFSLANYYQMLAQRNAREARVAFRWKKKAEKLLQAGSEIGQLYSATTYRGRLNLVNTDSQSAILL